MSKQQNTCRGHFSLRGKENCSNEARFPRASMGAFRNCKDIGKLLSDRKSILNLAIKIQQTPSVSFITEPAISKHSPILAPIEEVFVTPREFEPSKENFPIANKQETTPVSKLIDLSTSRQMSSFTLQSEDEEPSTVKNIVSNLQQCNVSSFEDFVSPRQFEGTPKALHTENATLLNKNKELMAENRRLREEYEERVRKLERQIAFTKQEIANKRGC
eukprot:TRINITY_DN10757_c0_g1_i3.p1 TRINITY_DN10757_c0_g1~~TRINITY_DN10757_c0_g1_i3.p1  ORF type:complete len:217 (+),score=44.44 TRINITY_DN10757_c0_g1_i3:92-742(+)